MEELSLQNTTLTNIIDISLLKDKQHKTNSDYILSIIEICINPNKYNLPKSNSTRNFWDEVLKNNDLNSLFMLFKAETLRKYWRIIRDFNQHELIISTVKQYESIINDPQFKLLPVIKNIIGYLKSKSNDSFDKYLHLIYKNKANNVTPSKIRKSIEQHEKEGIVKEILNKNEININDMVELFYVYFPHKTKDEIYQTLYETSGNINYTYLVLLNKEKHDNFMFIHTDDYILRNLRESKYYHELVKNKGEDMVKERERFLEINY